MVLCERKQVPYAPGPRLGTERNGGKRKTPDNAEGTEQIEPVIREPSIHVLQHTIKGEMDEAGLSDLVRNVLFGKNQGLSRDFDYPFIRTATRCGRQSIHRGRNVAADNSKVSTFQFPDIWATAAGIRPRTIFMRVWAESLHKVHAIYP